MTTIVQIVAKAIEEAQCRFREGPYGLYDYTSYGDHIPHHVRDFREPYSKGPCVFKSIDRDKAYDEYTRLTQEHLAIAAIKAYEDNSSSAGVPARWRVFEDIARDYRGIEEDVRDGNTILFPKKINREPLDGIVRAHNAALSTSQSDPAPEIAALRAENERLRELAQAVCDEEAHFRKRMPAEWDGDPVSDAIVDLRAAVSPEQEEAK